MMRLQNWGLPNVYVWKPPRYWTRVQYLNLVLVLIIFLIIGI